VGAHPFDGVGRCWARGNADQNVEIPVRNEPSTGEYEVAAAIGRGEIMSSSMILGLLFAEAFDPPVQEFLNLGDVELDLLGSRRRL
jgi:hypothetical protein